MHLLNIYQGFFEELKKLGLLQAFLGALRRTFFQAFLGIPTGVCFGIFSSETSLCLRRDLPQSF